MVIRDDILKRLISTLEQCRDTLEWQVGTNQPNVDFLYPKIKYALTLIDQSEEGDEERTTGDELRDYITATFDFRMPDNDEDEDN